MTPRRSCPPAPGPLEDYAAKFDDLFSRMAQRGCFRDYLVGLLLPRDRNKTLTGLAGVEPIVQAQAAPVHRLQWFLSEATWEVEAVNDRRIALLVADPVTRPHGRGVLILDETGDRKDGTKTAHVGYQYLGSLGKIPNWSYPGLVETFAVGGMLPPEGGLHGKTSAAVSAGVSSVRSSLPAPAVGRSPNGHGNWV